MRTLARGERRLNVRRLRKLVIDGGSTPQSGTRSRATADERSYTSRGNEGDPVPNIVDIVGEVGESGRSPVGNRATLLRG